MSKKYVPSFLKGKVSNSFAALEEKEEESIKEEKPLVNTSLPAKQAPVLAPATLASLTSNGAPPKPFVFPVETPVKEIKKKPLEASEFPSLGKPVSIALVQKTSYSELSKEWAKKQKEDADKDQAEKEKELAQQRSINKQKTDDMKKMGIISIPVFKKKLDPEEEAFRMRELAEKLQEEEDTPFEEVSVPYEEEEEEEEYGCDGNWSQRKHRDDLY